MGSELFLSNGRKSPEALSLSHLFANTRTQTHSLLLSLAFSFQGYCASANESIIYLFPPFSHQHYFPQSLNLAISTPAAQFCTDYPKTNTKAHTQRHRELLPTASSLTSYAIKSGPSTLVHSSLSIQLPFISLLSSSFPFYPDSLLSSFHFSFGVQINKAFIQAGML